MVHPPGGGQALPGNALGLLTECDRLRALGDRLDEAAVAVRDVRVDAWSGRARDRFDTAQYELSKRWRQAADAHHAAADALGDYQVALENLQQLERSERAEASGGDPARAAAAAELIGRWRLQQQEAGSRAARAVARAGDDLASLPPVLPPEPPAALAPPALAGPPPAPEPAAQEPPAPEPAAPRVESLHPEAALRDRDAYERELDRLNEAVRGAWRNPDQVLVIPLP